VRTAVGYNRPTMVVSDVVKALLLGIVEGLTEFLPISSTGHLIIVQQLLDFNDTRAKVFTIVIQTGAILAVVWEYRTRFVAVLTGLGTDPAAQRFVVNVAIAFLPLALLGLSIGSWIKANLFNAESVAVAFVGGALLILWAERRRHVIRVETVDDMRWRDALKVGVAQAFALIPGMSRAGSTIIGGLLFGLSRKAAAEFSFFLAVPTLISAGALDLYRNADILRTEDVAVFAVGFLAAFVSAFLAVRALLRYISRHDFTVFAWYRIVFGVLILVTAYAGIVDWSPH
jgi:undecaprenyl-diphosphatase